MNMVEKIREEARRLLEGTGISIKVDSLRNDREVIIDFMHYPDPKMDGMQILWEEGRYEVSEYQAGKNQDELWIYLETKSLKRAITNALKGNNRKPIKVWK